MPFRAKARNGVFVIGELRKYYLRFIEFIGVIFIA